MSWSKNDNNKEEGNSSTSASSFFRPWIPCPASDLREEKPHISLVLEQRIKDQGSSTPKQQQQQQHEYSRTASSSLLFWPQSHHHSFRPTLSESFPLPSRNSSAFHLTATTTASSSTTVNQESLMTIKQQSQDNLCEEKKMNKNNRSRTCLRIKKFFCQHCSSAFSEYFYLFIR